jgi:hypothetical protein
MVAGKVREHGRRKLAPVQAVLGKPDGGGLEREKLFPLGEGVGREPLEIRRLRCGHTGKPFLLHPHGGKGFTVRKELAQKVDDRGLSVRPRDPNRTKLFRGMPIKSAGDFGHGPAGVFHLKIRDRKAGKPLLAHHRHRSLLHRLGDKPMAIDLRSPEGKKEVARLDFSGIPTQALHPNPREILLSEKLGEPGHTGNLSLALRVLRDRRVSLGLLRCVCRLRRRRRRLRVWCAQRTRFRGWR